MKPCLALFFILASACATPQLAHTVTEVAATASHRVASSIVAVITHSPAGVHHYTAGAVMPHPVNTVASGSAIAPIAYICLLSLTTVDMTVLGFTVLDVANNPILVITVSGRPRPNTFFSRDWELSVAAGQSYSIFDIVETEPNFAEVEEQACRLRTACKVQQAVVTGAPHTLEQSAQLPPVPYTHAVVPVGGPSLHRDADAVRPVQATCVSHGPTVAEVTQTLMETETETRSTSTRTTNRKL